MKEFDVRTRIYFGTDALDRLKHMPYKRVMFMCDPFVVKSGLVQHALRRMKESGAEYTIYSDIVPDPPLSKVTQAIAAAIKFNPDVIVAIGGGSAIDTSKAVRKLGKNADPNFQPKLIAIPTTSGTGSEVTSFCVLTDPEQNTKIPLASADMIPDEAILDAILVKSVPADITADTGMDVLTHAIEAYVSINNNEFTAAMAEKSVELCSQYLLRSHEDNNDENARRKMHVASCLAGLAFNAASLGLNHGMAHQLGAEFHIPHGRANAILIPYIVEFNSEIKLYSRQRQTYAPVVQKYCNIARIMGVNNLNEVVTIRSLISYVRFMMKEMEMPLSVHAACPDLTQEEYLDKIYEMAEHALADDCTATNPRVPTLDDIIDIYKEIW